MLGWTKNLHFEDVAINCDRCFYAPFWKLDRILTTKFW